MYQRDPVSELFDRGAAALLTRAYQRPGQWTGTRLAHPPPQTIAHFAARGINVLGPPSRAQWETRWAEGFKRSMYHLHDWHYRSPLRGLDLTGRRLSRCRSPVLIVEVGRRVPALGIIPAGIAVRVRVLPGGQAAIRAARRLPARERFIDGQLGTVHVEPGPAWSDPGRRDWEDIPPSDQRPGR